MPALARNHKAGPARRGPAVIRRPSAAPPALDPIITMNAAGIIQSASDSVEKVFGWKPSELFGRNIGVFIPEPRRSDLDRYLDRYRRASRSDARSRTGRFDAVHKNGTVFPIELSMSRADLPAHSAPFFVGIIRDVSRQIDEGNNPEEDRSRLHGLITEQTRALATANLRLQLADRLASLGTLAAGLGHDMNNVLLPVRAHLQALDAAPIPASARGHLAALRSSILYLQQLSDSLHYLSHDPADADGAARGDGTTNLAEWWAQVGILLRKAVPRHVELRASIPPDLAAVDVASHWLTQAMLNLIVNAGEAIPARRNGIKGRVRIAAHALPGGAVSLSVSDNGRGMTPEVQRRAFDLFFTTKIRSMGTGLGLPLVQKVAARGGGRVEMASHPGKGTTVTLILPAAASSVQPLPLDSLSAVVSIREIRTKSLVLQVLRGAGLAIGVEDNGGPGKADIWITDPGPGPLRAAKRWKVRHPRRTVILVGVPPARDRPRWVALNATTIKQPNEFAAIRDAIVGAADHATPTPRART